MAHLDGCGKFCLKPGFDPCTVSGKHFKEIRDLQSVQSWLNTVVAILELKTGRVEEMPELTALFTVRLPT
jgi:hypothetical protein